MKKSELKALIKEVVDEIASNVSSHGHHVPVVNIGKLGPDYFIQFSEEDAEQIAEKLDAEGYNTEIHANKNGTCYIFFSNEQEAKMAKYHAVR
jgi:hypothetical protein